jgi:hypothetical protein
MTSGGVVGKPISSGFDCEYELERIVASSRDTIARERMFLRISICSQRWHLQSEFVPPRGGFEVLALGLHPEETEA